MPHAAMRRAITAAAALTTTALVALSGLASPAQAEVSADADRPEVKISRTSGVYGGAVVVVDVTYRCGESVIDSYLYVRVSQAGGPFGTVSGDGQAYAPCTSELETIAVAVPGYAAFGTGIAFATAELQICRETGCSTTEHSREIKIVPGTREARSFSSSELSYRLPKTGEIQAGGAGAEVLVPYTCSAGLFGDFDALLAQAADDGFVEASNDYATLRCTETSRSGVLAFHANGSGWAPGDAFVLVNGYACSEAQGCTSGTAYRSIRLT